MNTKKITAAVLFASFILMIAFPLPSAFAAKGPRMDNLLIKYYASVEAAYTALKASEIAMVWLL